jgi:hypothetical protein
MGSVRKFPIARGSPLYYASLCGFRDLAQHIINDHPEQVNATGGFVTVHWRRQCTRRYFNVAELLHQHGAVVNVTDYNNQKSTTGCIGGWT